MSAEVTWPNRMNPTDAVFWFMDKIPEFRSMIGALILLERPPSRQRIREDFERLAGRLPRMRQRVVEVPLGLAPPEWVDDNQFDLDYHLRQVAVPAPGGMDELLQQISPLYATPFDCKRPLWEAYVAEGLLGGRGAVFVKMHHCMTDGVGGSRLFEGLLGGRGEPAASPPPARVVERRSAHALAVLWRALLYDVQETIRASGAVVGGFASVVGDPRGTLAGIGRGLRAVSGFAREITASRARSPVRRRRSLSRRLATFDMSLAEIDAVRSRLGGTVNDIVLAIVSGAMHRWHTLHGADVRLLRALVPVSIRGERDPLGGNRLALLAMTLPIGEPNPLRRLRIIQQHMGQVKADRRATLYPWLAGVMMVLPLAIAKWIGRQQTMRTNFVCTNVPGPRRVCYLAGEAIERVYPYAPLVGDHPIAIALYSYRDIVCVGLDIDPMAMRDLPRFLDGLRESYEEMVNVGRHAEWAPRRRPKRLQRRSPTRHARSA